MILLRRLKLPRTSVEYGVLELLDTGIEEELRRLRTQTFADRYSCILTLNEEGVEADKWDSNSKSVALFYGAPGHETVIGGCRIIETRTGNLPIAEYVRIPIDKQSVEISRFFLSPDPTGFSKEDALILLVGFINVLDSYLRQLGYEHAYAVLRSTFASKLRFLRVPMEKIGEETNYAHVSFTPTVLRSRKLQGAQVATPAAHPLRLVAQR